MARAWQRRTAVLWEESGAAERLDQLLFSLVPGCRLPRPSELVLPLLRARGVAGLRAAEAFLRGDCQDADPFVLAGMPQAIERLRRALRHSERVAVYSDSDVDGLTSAVVLAEGLRAAGFDPLVRIGDRLTEGYGLSVDGLSELAAQGARLVISSDCGISAVEEVHHARALGMDVIVTDHHHVPQQTPEAVAVINPQQECCPYPYKELAGVGVAYKLVQALFQDLGLSGSLADIEEQIVELVALGTVVDVAPLVGENRTLAMRGLARMQRAARPGLQALAERASVRLPALRTWHLGFIFGPRLNAAGRLGVSEVAYRLLAAQEPAEAGALAERLERINQERLALLQRALDEATAQVLQRPDRPLIFVAGENWHPGVLGLVAMRLVERFERPAVVLQLSDAVCRGSARSVPGFHLVEALAACRELLVRFGGHEQAAGFTVYRQDIPALRSRLERLAEEALGPELVSPPLEFDAVLRASYLRPDVVLAVWRLVQALEPFGHGNPEPVFVTRRVKLYDWRLMGAEQQHLRCTLTVDGGLVEAVGWGMAGLAASLPRGGLVDVMYTFDENEWNGEKRVRLRLVDVRPAQQDPGV
jgi:single-stranded-DNA-specific exonuclease